MITNLRPTNSWPELRLQTPVVRLHVARDGYSGSFAGIFLHRTRVSAGILGCVPVWAVRIMEAARAGIPVG